MALDGTYLYRQTAGIVGVLIYHTTDNRATAIAANYFAASIDDLNLRDVIHIIHTTGGTPGMTTVFVSAIDRTAGTIAVTETALA